MYAYLLSQAPSRAPRRRSTRPQPVRTTPRLALALRDWRPGGHVRDVRGYVGGRLLLRPVPRANACPQPDSSHSEPGPCRSCRSGAAAADPVGGGLLRERRAAARTVERLALWRTVS